MRFIRFINPKHCRGVALNKPTSAEKGQWYFNVILTTSPIRVKSFFFDRSWYNRTVVKSVMDFYTTEQYDLFIK
jgi:polyphosphate kinase 2 (PPK2 family)